ncbi:MAG: bifunctional hydroxymethylpyrimidine kinase/phosphomethylpyrimidine kinase [Bacillota bacterium]
MTAVKQVLTIAGSDSGGGAGIQADIKTFQELGVYSTSVLTAVTAQNTLGVSAIYPMSAEAVQQQLEAVAQDFQIDSVKTGMLFSAALIEETARCLRAFNWRNIVVDPVMIAKGGAVLLQQDAMDALKNHLLPLADVVTPNIPEAEALSGITIRDETDRRRAAEQILLSGAASVVVKGGHWMDHDVAEDFYLHKNGESFALRSPRIQSNQTHGTGCTFSAALTAELAKGKTMEESLCTAKQFIHAALADPLNIGSGHGPTNHMAFKRSRKLHMDVIQLVH